MVSALQAHIKNFDQIPEPSSLETLPSEDGSQFISTYRDRIAGRPNHAPHDWLHPGRLLAGEQQSRDGEREQDRKATHP